ncbi:MAG: RluA family pseudouridine synthase [Euzebya sp.]
MSTEQLRRVVADAEDGLRLDVVLADWLQESRSRSQRRIAEAQVSVDGVGLPKSSRVETGQTVVVMQAPEPSRPVPPTVDILYRDHDVAVVAKPADLVVHDGTGVRGSTLVDALLAQGIPLAPADDPTRPGIVHRLDRGTSGLLVVATSQLALTRLREVFKAHDVVREYWTLVEGFPDPPTATIDAPIVRSVSNRTSFTTGDGGRRAVTHYTTIAQHSDTAEVEVQLETGRTHQVRVHLRAVGRPVAGDVVYGASPQRSRALGLSRPALHARRLAFDHPVSGQRIDVSQPLPDDLERARQLAAG